jgi:excisionase family DNA binding protein
MGVRRSSTEDNVPPLPPDQISPFETTDPSRRVNTRAARPGNSVYGSGSARGPPFVAEAAPFVTVKGACALGGLGRSKLYELLGLGLVRAVKLGTRTLIETASLLAYLESLPTAQIRPLKRQGTSPLHPLATGRRRTDP